ncbi:MAG: EAL domain-containing protein [Cyanobacteria bacterium SBLK]|nr:EAL domain-containing protein [Cyanobacteria bacterium SBLK]
MTPDLFYGKIPDILIADGTLDSLRLISQSLSSHGYDVRSAATGTLAIASAREMQPDLILLDIKMPDLSGYEVCCQLKQDPRTCDIPIIFISALNEPFDKVKAFSVGGVDYIVKPFRIEEALARIQSQLERYFSLIQIQKLNAELEQRVQERTEELRASNQTLQQEIADRQKIAESLRESESKFRQISEHIQEVFWLICYDAHLKEFKEIEYVSPAFAEIWGRTCESLYENSWEWIAAIHPHDRQKVQVAFKEKAARGLFDEEYRVVRPDGTLRWIRDRGFPIYNDRGEVYRVAGIAENITQRKQAELERDRFFNLSLDLFFITDETGKFKRLNSAWMQLLGYAPSELIGGSFWDFAHPEDLPLVKNARGRLRRGEDVNALEIRCCGQDGEYYWMAWNIVPFPRENLFYGVGRDISQRKASEARLIYETLHDALTGLGNRTYFMEQLEIAFKKGKRQRESHFAILFIDLDDFKRINDTLGHAIGDRLLVQVSQILQASVREVDSVARLGGDEFVILLENANAWQDVLKVVERIQERLKSPFHPGDREVFVSTSIGVIFSKPDYRDPCEILRDADIAMYRAKAKGKGCYEVFDRAMYAQTLYRIELENALRSAIANEELQLYYQPIIRLQPPLQLEGFEVLLRWYHREKGAIPASEFIPIAEETGLINEIGEWVLEKACRQFQAWRSIHANFVNLYLSLNISGRQLRESSFIHILDRVLQETQIPRDCLELEITESSLIENQPIAAQILQAIKQRGIAIGLDDFGTGCSSLQSLHQFPFDIIKIDRAFVQTIEEETRESRIVHSIVMLARALDLGTVAEGIETEEQLKKLQELGCESGQGYWFSEPISGDRVEGFLRAGCFDRRSIRQSCPALCPAKICQYLKRSAAIAKSEIKCRVS